MAAEYEAARARVSTGSTSTTAATSTTTQNDSKVSCGRRAARRTWRGTTSLVNGEYVSDAVQPPGRRCVLLMVLQLLHCWATTGSSWGTSGPRPRATACFLTGER